MMSEFDEDTSIDSLPILVYKELVDELNKDSRWLLLARYVSEELECLSQSWIRSVECKDNALSKNGTPAEQLLFELNIKMCTVGIFCTLLESCELLNVLSILRAPEPLIIVKHPNFEMGTNELEITLGQHLRLTCAATSLPPPKYLWYHNDAELHDHVTDQLNIVVTSPMQEGKYKCKVSQISRDGQLMDQLFSESMSVKIKSTSVIITKQPLLFLEVREGDSFNLSCEAESHPKPQYQWFRDNTRLDEETSNVLHINRFSGKNEGKYYCYVFNIVSEAYTQRSIVMMELPRQKAIAKIALLIANENYEHHEKLGTPKNDAAKIARQLSQIGFKVICLLNLTLVQMKNAMKVFCEAISEGVYGLFYFAGHGFKMQESYMLSIDAPEVYLRKDAICESQLLAMVLQSDPALLVIILDMCQTVPPKELNPGIHNEVPIVDEYKGRKNLRNLVQAYSTSSYRPSYERTSNDCGLYVTHLSKHIDRDIPVTKMFKEVGKSIDTWLRGAERNQIPMFALTVTKPFRLTDAIYKKNPPAGIANLNKLTAFPTKTIDIKFDQSGVQGKVTVCPFMEPYLNIVRIVVSGLDNWEVNFHNSTRTEQNNLFQRSHKKECRLYNPQISKGPLVISLHKNGVPVGATLFRIMDHVPAILQRLDL